jgi:hypothetical protein
LSVSYKREYVLKRSPIPDPSNKNSAATTPTKPKAIPCLIPLIEYGRTEGKTMSLHILNSLDLKELATSISRGFIALAPSIVVIQTGKKTNQPTIKDFGP